MTGSECPRFIGLFYLKVYWFSENLLIIMKYVRTSFLDESYEHEISVDVDGPGKILISISSCSDDNYSAEIYLHVDTAVKFSKEIRRKIAEVKDSNQNILKDGE